MSSNFLNALAGTRLYPLTDRHLSGRTLPEQVAYLGNEGAKLIQLREKLLAPLEFYKEAEAALHVARKLGVSIIINDRVDMALALKADGVHLGQSDLPPEAARRILGPQAIIGFSTHNLAQARLAVQMPVDYVAFGPIFSTATKQGAETPTGLPALRQVRQSLGQTPLVAIGGITSANTPEVIAAGADAVAVISDIWIRRDAPAA